MALKRRSVIAIGVFVLRAGAVSNLLAIPGGLLLLAMISRRIQASSRAAFRVPAQTAAVLLLLPITPAVTAVVSGNRDRDGPGKTK